MDAKPLRRELEAAWREGVDSVRARYAEKVAIRRQVVAERPVLPMCLEPDLDGRFALHLALQEESAARTEYMRVLTIHTELILRGMPPEKEPGS